MEGNGTMKGSSLISRLVAAVTHSGDTRPTPPNDPTIQAPRTGAGLRSWYENTAYAAGYSSDGKTTLFLSISEPRVDSGGNTYHSVGITKKLHHATLFSNKRRLHLMKERIPLAYGDYQSREYLAKAFPVPVYARPIPPRRSRDTSTLWTDEGGGL